MNKTQKILLSLGLAVVGGLIALVIILIVNNSDRTEEVNQAREEMENLRLANDRLALENEFTQLNSDFSQYEDQQIYLKNDSLVQQYNQARMKVEGLLAELDEAKKAHNRDNEANRKRIKELEGQIATLKDILKHYLEEIKRLGEENEGLKKEIAVVTEKNVQLETKVTQATNENKALAQTVTMAKKLNITGVSLTAYNNKGKVEKNITKAKQLGVSFTVSPNNTASAGMKDFYIRILTPEGMLLGGGDSFKMDGASIAATAKRQVEYSNEELSVTIYWDVNTTLTPGDYTVEVFADGGRLASKHFTMVK